jgi:hypothetical protein
VVADVEARQPLTLVSWGGRQAGPPNAQWTLTEAAKGLGLKEAEVIAGWRWVCLRAWFKRALLPPARSWRRLSEIGDALRGELSSNIDGYLTGVLYDRYMNGGDEPDWALLLEHAEDTLVTLGAVEAACRLPQGDSAMHGASSSMIASGPGQSHR